jgi:hypothetical protein
MSGNFTVRATAVSGTLQIAASVAAVGGSGAAPQKDTDAKSKETMTQEAFICFANVEGMARRGEARI